MTIRISARLSVAAEKVVKKIKSVPQALKRKHILSNLAARVELVPFPRPCELDSFRSHFQAFLTDPHREPLQRL